MRNQVKNFLHRLLRFACRRQRRGLLLFLIVALLSSSLLETAWGANEFLFTFENADVHAVLKKASELTGMTFLFDPEQVKGKITILPAKKVSPEEALQLLQSALTLHGYALVSEKGVGRVVPAAQAAALAKYTVEVVPLNYARAEEVAYTLAALAPPGVTIVPYYPTNSLLIAGNPEAVAELLGTIKGKEEKPAEKQGD